MMLGNPDGKNLYKIPVTWEVYDTIEVQGNSLEEALQCLKKLNPTSKTLESHVLKAIVRANKHIDNHVNLSGGDPNINKHNQTKKILNKKVDINAPWGRADDVTSILENKRSN